MLFRENNMHAKNVFDSVL